MSEHRDPVSLFSHIFKTPLTSVKAASDILAKHLGGDLNFAWPDVEIAVMGPEGAVNIIYRKELAAAENPDALRGRRISQYRKEIANPYTAAAHGYLDDIILPKETRSRLISALETLQNKRQKTPARKHGNIPL